jgi:hypothetical protein
MAKLTKKEQAAADAEALRIAALPLPVEGEPYDPVRHPSALLDKAGLGVSYDDVTAPVLVPTVTTRWQRGNDSLVCRRFNG